MKNTESLNRGPGSVRKCISDTPVRNVRNASESDAGDRPKRPVCLKTPDGRTLLRTDTSSDVQKIRAAMGAHMAAFADAVRDTFGGRLVYLKTPTLTKGQPLPDPPAPWDYRHPAFSKKGTHP